MVTAKENPCQPQYMAQYLAGLSAAVRTMKTPVEKKYTFGAGAQLMAGSWVTQYRNRGRLAQGGKEIPL